jgi:hypothetical protein
MLNGYIALPNNTKGKEELEGERAARGKDGDVSPQGPSAQEPLVFTLSIL